MRKDGVHHSVLREALLEAPPPAMATSSCIVCIPTNIPRDRVAGWAKLVDQAARAGDAVASDILGSAAQQLATLTAAVRAQLFEQSGAVNVCYSGGVFSSQPLLERFRMLVELEEGNRVSAPRHNAAEGGTSRSLWHQRHIA